MANRLPKTNDIPTDGDDRPAGGTNPLSGPVIVIVVLVVVALVVGILLVMMAQHAAT
jgi:hypothetical protein